MIIRKSRKIPVRPHTRTVRGKVVPVKGHVRLSGVRDKRKLKYIQNEIFLMGIGDPRMAESLDLFLRKYGHNYGDITDYDIEDIEGIIVRVNDQDYFISRGIIPMMNWVADVVPPEVWMNMIEDPESREEIISLYNRGNVYPGELWMDHLYYKEAERIAEELTVELPNESYVLNLTEHDYYGKIYPYWYPEEVGGGY